VLPQEPSYYDTDHLPVVENAIWVRNLAFEVSRNLVCKQTLPQNTVSEDALLGVAACNATCEIAGPGPFAPQPQRIVESKDSTCMLTLCVSPGLAHAVSTCFRHLFLSKMLIHAEERLSLHIQLGNLG
jgi:hypothetical protein